MYEICHGSVSRNFDLGQSFCFMGGKKEKKGGNFWSFLKTLFSRFHNKKTKT